MEGVFLYGPPGSGKTTLGKILAGRFSINFEDLDKTVAGEAGMGIPEIFAREGEAGFRGRETAALRKSAAGAAGRKIVALGGGALLKAENREFAEANGTVVCLECAAEELHRRLAKKPGSRPLADAGERLDALLKERAEHYEGFAHRLSAHFAIDSGDEPSDVLVGRGLIGTVGEWARMRGMGKRAVVVADENTAPLYAGAAEESLKRAGFEVRRHVIPAGEATKDVSTVGTIWRAFLEAGLDRNDFAVAVGGGVTGDLTGFAAATWMRGMRWINVPTSLLAMVDASTGGKTGFDLPEAKNMVGAFHSPTFVIADSDALKTLPERELGCGLAETIKHAIIGDPGLAGDLTNVARSLAVKVRIVTADAKEKGERAKLNLGHTVGHAVETATNFAVKHGEAVAIGTVEEAKLAVKLGLAPAGWEEQVAELFRRAGLPVELPQGIEFAGLVDAMRRDKKKRGDEVLLALPCAMGDVRLTPVAYDTLLRMG